MDNHDDRRQQPVVNEDEAADNSHPLHGVVLCCTSIPPEIRTEIAEQAERMGATHTYDLTSDVTHLIVGSYDTPKYRFVARERPDIKVVTEKFIREMREFWVLDQAFDLPELERKHSRPIFQGLKISVTGFDDFELRERLSRGIQDNGGQYSGDLTRHHTHLIAARTEGAKFTHATGWGLKVVSFEWFEQCLERGMILDEVLYHPSIPASERGAGAWKKLPARASPLGKRNRDAVDLGEGKRKLRRTASSKLSSQSQNLWGDIVGGGSFTKDAPKVDQWEETGRHEHASARQSMENPSLEPTMASEPAPVTKKGMFANYCFYSHGFDIKKSKVLHQYLHSYGGKIVSNLERLLSESEASPDAFCYLILPHQLPPDQRPEVPNGSRITSVTEWWVEKCVANKATESPSNHVLNRPFRRFPLEGFSGMSICSTAFNGIELLHVKKSVELLGATYSEDFTPLASLLVCNYPKTSSSIEKMKYAREWNIPVVSSKWLWDSIDSGLKQEFLKYLYASKASSKGSEKSSGSSRSKVTTDKSSTVRSGRILTGDSAPADDSWTTVAPDESYTMRPTVDSGLPPTMKQASGSETCSEPLREISPNSPKKQSSSPPKEAPHSTVPTQIAPTISATRAAELAPDVATTISLLRSRAGEQQEADGPDRRRRAHTRILGRATSNASASSTGITRASSIDSEDSERGRGGGTGVAATAGAGASSIFADGIAGLPAQMYALDAARTRAAPASPPPATQKLHYADPESSEYKERVVARMLGAKEPAARAKPSAAERVRSVVGDVVSAGRQLRRRPGFR